MIERLIETLAKRGLTITKGNAPDELLLKGPDSERTEQVMAALKEFKPLLIEWFSREQNVVREYDMQPAKIEGDPQPDDDGEICRQCNATWYCSPAEIRERVQSPHWCATPSCPYRSK